MAQVYRSVDYYDCIPRCLFVTSDQKEEFSSETSECAESQDYIPVEFQSYQESRQFKAQCSEEVSLGDLGIFCRWEEGYVTSQADSSHYSVLRWEGESPQNRMRPVPTIVAEAFGSE